MITYAAHKGERPYQSRHIKPDALIGKIELHGKEGKTKQCEAYQSLADLLEIVEALPVRLTNKEGVRWHLERQLPVPPEILMNYPDLLLDYGV